MRVSDLEVAFSNHCEFLYASDQRCTLLGAECTGLLKEESSLGDTGYEREFRNIGRTDRKSTRLNSSHYS